MSGEPRRKRPEAPARPNHILLYTIVNPAYPITVDVIHTISSPHGQVQRIVVFKKNGVQAMVEFESLESATRAKEMLHGHDIYSGCCTLKIEYAKPERLNVFKNDQDSWDYTVKEDQQSSPPPRSAPLLQAPQYPGGRPQPYNMEYGSGGPGPGLMKEPRHHGPPHHHQGPLPPYGGGGAPPPPPPHHHAPPPHHHAPPPHHHAPPPHHHGPPHHGPPPPHHANQQGHQQGAVMMVYGLDPQTANADRLFNLVCLYGNVVRIKFLKTKEGTAMVQMGDTLSVERCVQNLNNVSVGDHALTLAFSKQPYLSEVMNPYPLPDKSPSFKDYVGNKNNRFLTAASVHKNRIQPPSKIIHFFNTPPDVSEEQLLAVFKDYGVAPPHQISKFPLKSDRSSSGLMEFSNISHSVMAIMACNHATITHPGAKFPFLMKLCFSSARAIGPAQGAAASPGTATSGAKSGAPGNNGQQKDNHAEIGDHERDGNDEDYYNEAQEDEWTCE